MVCTNTLRRTERWSRTTSRLTRITVLMIEMESLLRLHLIVKRMSYFLSSSSKSTSGFRISIFLLTSESVAGSFWRHSHCVLSVP